MKSVLEEAGRSIERFFTPESKLEIPPLPYGEAFDVPEDLIEAVSNLPKGEHDSYGATPLHRSRTLKQQIELETTLRKRTYNVPTGVSMWIANSIQNTFAQRFHKRAEANEENYETSLSDGREYLPIAGVKEMYIRSELGEASPGELLMTRKMKRIRSIELACLTHPYGNGIEMLEPMRDAVKTSVDFLGGTYNENPENIYRVKDAIKHEETGEVLGYLMTRKHVLGMMPDGTEIRERSSFFLQIEAPTIIEMLGEDMESAMNEYETIGQLLKLDDISAAFLQYDQFSAAIPISSTIYAFNRFDAAEIEQKAIETRQAEAKKFAKKYPLLYALSLGDRTPLEYAPETKTDLVKRKARVLPKVMANKLRNLF